MHIDRIRNPSISSFPDDQNEDEDDLNGDTMKILWKGIHRREWREHLSTPDHELTLKMAQALLLARIYGGASSYRFHPWPEEDKQQPSQEMLEAWREARRLQKAKDGHSDIEDCPTGYEARKVIHRPGQS